MPTELGFPSSTESIMGFQSMDGWMDGWCAGGCWFTLACNKEGDVNMDVGGWLYWDYCIGSNFWKLYLIRTGFTLGELVWSV